MTDNEQSDFIAAMERAFMVASSVDPKTPLQATSKLAEEVGELMREVLIVSETPGCTYRSSSHEKRVEEAADVMLCILAAVRKLDIGVQELASAMQHKTDKWESSCLRIFKASYAGEKMYVAAFSTSDALKVIRESPWGDDEDDEEIEIVEVSRSDAEATIILEEGSEDGMSLSEMLRDEPSRHVMASSCF